MKNLFIPHSQVKDIRTLTPHEHLTDILKLFAPWVVVTELNTDGYRCYDSKEAYNEYHLKH